jgi:CBS domain-containing protein
MKSAFPVTDAGGRLLGMVTLKRVMDASHEDESKKQVLTIRDVMIPLEELNVVDPDIKGDKAIEKMTSSRNGKIFVCDAEVRLLGMVTKTDLLNVASERQEYSKSVSN